MRTDEEQPMGAGESPRTRGEIAWANRTAAGRARLERRVRLLHRGLEGVPNPVVVELGCGAGLFAERLRVLRADIRYVGLDLAPLAVAYAARRNRSGVAVFCVADALRLPCADGCADVVAGNSILHHLPLNQALAEVYRVLRPGGLLFFAEPNMLNPQVALQENVSVLRALVQTSAGETAFVRWEMAESLRKAGFREVSVQPFDFLHPFMPGLLVPIASGFGALAERLPLMREIAAALLVQAKK